MSMKIKNFAFRKHVSRRNSGAITLGWCSFDIVVDESSGASVSLRDLAVRVNARGEHTLCAPSRPYKNRQGEHRSSSAYRFDDSTYGALRDAIFATGPVLDALRDAAGELKLTA
jgi:hypothetical protein